jgi:hypothetical protein
VLNELEHRAIEGKEGKLRKRDAFFFEDDKPPPQEM